MVLARLSFTHKHHISCYPSLITTNAMLFCMNTINLLFMRIGTTYSLYV